MHTNRSLAFHTAKRIEAQLEAELQALDLILDKTQYDWLNNNLDDLRVHLTSAKVKAQQIQQGL